MALAGANITLTINPKPLATSSAFFSPPPAKMGSSIRLITSRPHPSLVKCSSEQIDGGGLKNALSSILGDRVEELLGREENRAILDRLSQASERVDLARREQEKIEKQEIEVKKMREYIQMMETRASQVAECQKEVLQAKVMLEEAERSLLMNMDEFGPEDGAVETESTEINRDVERLESVKAASISAIVGTLAGLPIYATQVTSGTQLLLPLFTTFISCALFGVTFRYAVRRDLDNIQLKTGTAAAFGFVKGLGMLDGGSRLELNMECFTSHAFDRILSISQDVFIFIFAAVALDFCFKMRLSSPFPLRRSTARSDTK